MSEMKTCTMCGKVLPLSEYYQSRGKYHAECKECLKARMRRMRKERKHRKDPAKPCTVVREGRLMVSTRGGYRILWTGDMLSVLRKYYPNTPSKEVAEMVGVNVVTLTSKAKELGLCKDKDYMARVRKERAFWAHVALRKKRRTA